MLRTTPAANHLRATDREAVRPSGGVSGPTITIPGSALVSEATIASVPCILLIAVEIEPRVVTNTCVRFGLNRPAGRLTTASTSPMGIDSVPRTHRKLIVLSRRSIPKHKFRPEYRATATPTAHVTANARFGPEPKIPTSRRIGAAAASTQPITRMTMSCPSSRDLTISGGWSGGAGTAAVPQSRQRASSALISAPHRGQGCEAVTRPLHRRRFGGIRRRRELAVDACDPVGVDLVEGLVLEQRPGERLELRPVVGQRFDRNPVALLHRPSHLGVDLLAGGLGDAVDPAREQPRLIAGAGQHGDRADRVGHPPAADHLAGDPGRLFEV